MAHTDESLRQFLNKIAKEQNYGNPEIIINEISSGGANYTSKLFTVIIREENKEDLHLFAKVAALGEKFRNGVDVMVYETEHFVYAELGNIYATLEEENRVPEEHRLFFTKFYGFDSSLYRETIILENLLAHGYGTHDRFHSITWDYAAAAVTELAKMHALSFAFSEKCPEEFEKTLKRLKIDWSGADGMLQNSVKTALKTVKPEYKKALENFFNENMSFGSIYNTVRKTGLVHTDYRGNNLLHKVQEDGKVDIKIVDLQTLQGGSPVADLIYFIVTGSDEEFRAKYYEKLLDHYYTELSAAMQRLNLDPEETFSRDDFEFEMKEKLPFGLTLAVFALPVVTVDSENAPEVNESLELSNFSVEKTSDLYAERLNGVVNDYVKWGILK